jgi:hypothetical protein
MIARRSILTLLGLSPALPTLAANMDTMPAAPSGLKTETYNYMVKETGVTSSGSPMDMLRTAVKAGIVDTDYARELVLAARLHGMETTDMGIEAYKSFSPVGKQNLRKRLYEQRAWDAFLANESDPFTKINKLVYSFSEEPKS